MKSENVIIMIVILIVLSSIILGFVYADSEYHRGFEAGKNYVPPTMSRIDSLTIPEFTPAERRIITQFMIIIKRAAEVKE